MGWHLAPSLVRLRDEINVRWPHRPKGSDGTIGDASHAARKSDHNPNSRGSVNAIDITFPGVDAKQVIAAVKAHPSASYVIFNGLIYSAKNAWKPVKYTGASPHREHLHISIKQSVKAEQSTVRWFDALVKPVVSLAGWRLPKGHVFGQNPRNRVSIHDGSKSKRDNLDVKKIQSKLLVRADGLFGPSTARAARLWQAKRLLPPTGRVDQRMWNRLGL